MRLKPPPRRLVYALLTAASMLLACGAGFWALDPRIGTWWDGIWLAFTTATTLGYGDLVPSGVPSRLFAMFVILCGLGVISLLTATLTYWLSHVIYQRDEKENAHFIAIKKDLEEIKAALKVSSDP